MDGRTSARAFKGQQREADPINSFKDSIRKLVNEPWGTPHLWIIPVDRWALPTLCAPHLRTHAKLRLALCACLQGNKSEPLQTACEHAQKTSTTLWDLENPHKLEHLAPPQGKQATGKQSALCLACQDQEAYSLKNYPPRGNKKCAAGVAIENV